MPVPWPDCVKNLETSMNDRFEDAVRDALHGLPTDGGEIPSYHDAWQRGRRRRLIKRSALAAAGAVIFLAALTVNLGRLPGSGTTEIDDIATGIEVATPVFEPTPLATTSPVERPDPAAASAEAQALALPTPTADQATQVPATATPDVSAPAPAPTSEAAPLPTATPRPVTPEPTPTAPPTSVPAPTATPVLPTPTIVPQDSADQAAETGDAATTITPAESDVATDPPVDADPNGAAGTAQQPPDPGSPDDQLAEPELALTTGAAADAVLLGGAARGVAIPCDIDGDGAAEATCELLVDYPCTGVGDVLPGYSAIDVDGDQTTDTCVAAGITRCDTMQDGIGDTPCIIELTSTPPEQSDEDG